MNESNIKILLVDDNPANLMAMSEILKDLGGEVVTAPSGREALKQVLQHDFAVILLDVQMPEMDGFETAELIRRRPRSRHTPIIFVTAIGKSDDYVHKGYSLGAVDYVFKPVVPEILRQKVSVFIDLQRMANEIKRYAEQVEAANQELEAFNYTVSHDLRAPLRAISGFAEALSETNLDRVDEDGRRYIQKIRAACGRMGTLIDQLLELSRLGRKMMVVTEVNLSEIAAQITDDMRRNQPQRKVRVRIDPSLTVKGDPTLLRSSLENLLANAWKFTRDKPTARIEFGALKGNIERAYFVRDNGVGFDMKYADKLFGIFSRLHSATQFEGSGVGLASVKRVIQRHGGRVWAESEVGKGTTIYFTLKQDA